MAKRWYVVHAYSGYEKQVMRALHERIERFEMQDVFGDVLVPTEEVIEMRAGKKRRSERKFYPGSSEELCLGAQRIASDTRTWTASYFFYSTTQ